MSGIIGANNQFGNDFNNPDANMQDLIVSIYDVRTYTEKCCNRRST